MITSRSFKEINFIELHGSLDNPIFCGRSTFPLHPKHRIFKYSGYSYMPWISYMTLLTNKENHLIFCWLERDEIHAKHLIKLIGQKAPKELIALLAYTCSDALAIDENYYKRHATIIDEVIKKYKVY